MASSEDFKKLYELYKTEEVPNGKPPIQRKVG